jgi:acyl carrier protein
MATKTETASQVRELFVDHLGDRFDELYPSDTDQFGLSRVAAPNEAPFFDSLDRVELMMAVEESFDVRISDVEAVDCDSIAKIADLVDQKLATPR